MKAVISLYKHHCFQAQVIQLAVWLYVKYHVLQVNLFSEEGASPLILATSLNNEAMVKILLAYGAEPNLKSIYGFSAIDLARQMGSQRLLSLMDKQVI